MSEMNEEKKKALAAYMAGAMAIKAAYNGKDLGNFPEDPFEKWWSAPERENKHDEL